MPIESICEAARYTSEIIIIDVRPLARKRRAIAHRLSRSNFPLLTSKRSQDSRQAPGR